MVREKNFNMSNLKQGCDNQMLNGMLQKSGLVDNV